MNRKQTASRRAAFAIAAMLCGGSTFTSCDTRVRTSVVAGMKDFVFGLLDPQFVFAALLDSPAEENNNVLFP